MARLKITTDKALLRKTSKPVTDFGQSLHLLLDDMTETLEGVGGVGLAAIQVGVLWRAAIIQDNSGEYVEIINPTIVAQSRFADHEEMCLSLPKLCLVISRPTRVTLRAQDRFGNHFERKFRDLAAVCACHECDHMDGILFPDRQDEKRASEKRVGGGAKRGDE